MVHNGGAEVTESLPASTPIWIPNHSMASTHYNATLTDKNLNATLDTKEKHLAARLGILRDQCRGTNAGSTSQHITEFTQDKVHVQDKYKIMYCLIPKVGCSNMKLLMRNVSAHGTHPDDLKNPHSQYKLAQAGVYPLTHFDGDDLISRVKHYTKVILVRHPLTRLLSAYRDKLESGSDIPFLRNAGRKIIAKYRKNPTKEALKMGTGVKFTEFLQFLIDSGKRGDFLNQHWAPYTLLCDPCHMNYDIVMKLETVDSDMEYIKDLVYGGHSYATIPAKYATVTQVETMKKYYDDISDKQLQGIIDFFRHDFTMFGYGFTLEDALQSMQGKVI